MPNLPIKKIKKSDQQGFLQIILFIIVAVVILHFVGLSPLAIWENIIKPILTTLWDALLAFFTIIIELIDAVVGGDEL